MISIKNKTAIITGGNAGIGFGIAEALVLKDMNVVITSRTLAKAQAAAALLNEHQKGKALGVECDVRNYSQMQQVVETCLDTFGKLDCLVANAGIGHFAPIEDMSHEQWNSVIDTNLTGVFNSVKACIPALKETKGYIITLSSLAGSNFFANGAAYNASKFGVTGFTQAIMLDLRPLEIKVSTIMPGSVSSHFNGHTPNEADAWKIQPEDIGQIVQGLLEMHPRTLPSKIEVRPSKPM